MQFEHQVAPGVSLRVVLTPHLSSTSERIVASVVPGHVNVGFCPNCVQNLTTLKKIQKKLIESNKTSFNSGVMDLAVIVLGSVFFLCSSFSFSLRE